MYSHVSLPTSLMAPIMTPVCGVFINKSQPIPIPVPNNKRTNRRQPQQSELDIFSLSSSSSLPSTIQMSSSMYELLDLATNKIDDNDNTDFEAPTSETNKSFSDLVFNGVDLNNFELFKKDGHDAHRNVIEKCPCVLCKSEKKQEPPQQFTQHCVTLRSYGKYQTSFDYCFWTYSSMSTDTLIQILRFKLEQCQKESTKKSKLEAKAKAKAGLAQRQVRSSTRAQTRAQTAAASAIVWFDETVCSKYPCTMALAFSLQQKPFKRHVGRRIKANKKRIDPTIQRMLAIEQVSTTAPSSVPTSNKQEVTSTASTSTTSTTLTMSSTKSFQNKHQSNDDDDDANRSIVDFFFKMDEDWQ